MTLPSDTSPCALRQLHASNAPVKSIFEHDLEDMTCLVLCSEPLLAFETAAKGGAMDAAEARADDAPTPTFSAAAAASRAATKAALRKEVPHVFSADGTCTG